MLNPARLCSFFALHRKATPMVSCWAASAPVDVSGRDEGAVTAAALSQRDTSSKFQEKTGLYYKTPPTTNPDTRILQEGPPTGGPPTLLKLPSESPDSRARLRGLPAGRNRCLRAGIVSGSERWIIRVRTEVDICAESIRFQYKISKTPQTLE